MGKQIFDQNSLKKHEKNTSEKIRHRRIQRRTLQIAPKQRGKCQKPLDVLAQIITSECACEEWDVKGLYNLIKGSHYYQDLTFEIYAVSVA